MQKPQSMEERVVGGKIHARRSLVKYQIAGECLWVEHVGVLSGKSQFVHTQLPCHYATLSNLARRVAEPGRYLLVHKN